MNKLLLHTDTLIKSATGFFKRRVPTKKINSIYTSTPQLSCVHNTGVTVPASVTPVKGMQKVKLDNERPILTELENLELHTGEKFPAIQRENIRPESLCLVHLDDYAPAGNRILSAKEALTVDGVAATRNSVHFTLNHPVNAHRYGDWSGQKYVILMPYNATKAANKPGKFIEGLANDLYTNGSVTIPKGSVIIKKNPDIPLGKIQVSNYADIDGVKLIETSSSPYGLSMPIMEKMGYSPATVDNGLGVFDIGIEKTSKEQFIKDVEKNYKYWSEFCAREGIKPMQHCGSPNGEAESMIECLNMLAADNAWKFEFWGNKMDSKVAILDKLKFINKNAEKYNYFISFDTNKLAKIVEESATPRIALERVEKELKLKPIKTLERNETPQKEYYSTLDIKLSHNDVTQKYLEFFNNETSDPKAINEFLESACLWDLVRMSR